MGGGVTEGGPWGKPLWVSLCPYGVSQWGVPMERAPEGGSLWGCPYGGALCGGDPKEGSLWGEFLWLSLWGAPIGRVAMGRPYVGGLYVGGSQWIGSLCGGVTMGEGVTVGHPYGCSLWGGPKRGFLWVGVTEVSLWGVPMWGALWGSLWAGGGIMGRAPYGVGPFGGSRWGGPYGGLLWGAVHYGVSLGCPYEEGVLYQMSLWGGPMGGS